MPSKYRPQRFGWIGDLEKGKNYLTSPEDRLLYANDNYCVFKRKILSDQIFYLSISSFLSISLFFLIPMLIYDIATLKFDGKDSKSIFIILFVILICFIFIWYSIIPEFYQNLFTRRGSPIIFNRKTGKVYVNESYFFSFRFWYNPLVFLHPNKRRIKEYDWADLHGVAIHNYSPYSLVSDILMVCKPGTNQTIDHIMFDPARKGVGSHLIWGWVNNYMIFDKLADPSRSIYPTDQEDKFKQKIINGQGWPKWMIEAFNATTQDELTNIKQKYQVKQ
ncbi:hypothetical protein GYM75_02125 [Gilliamella sp. ESL0441]|uniref:DUF6708 domain-containing protein n=1 Tax=Gilliamella sp. ESL0441 TaxID=2704654 RepID=UPI001C69DAAC|nr:DUF6708 domain-containing protein [Gilliamella sp. ESL0441]QYN43720.1 hypothetical protein GYM75_02125 [Gilliamella sp. ESL0441]